MKPHTNSIQKTILVLLAMLLAIALLPHTLHQTNANQSTNTTLTLHYGNKSWTYNHTHYNAQSKIHTVQDQARKVRLPTHEKRIELCKKLIPLGSYQVALEHVFLGISRVTNSIKRSIDKPPKPAEIFFNKHTAAFTIKKERDGYNINLEKLYKSIFTALEKSPTAHVTLKPEILTHQITAEALSACAHKRAEFTTSYERSSPERKHNVELALKKINGERLNHNDVLSFNTVVGSRTARRGFKEAKIIKNGQFEDGIGGGVCQSSTTLYNASLLGGLKILKVYQHSLPVGYVEPSFDAMVNSSYADLVISNPSELPVFFRTICTNSTATVEVYGAPLPYKIVRRSQTTGKIPHQGYKTIKDTSGKYADLVQFLDEEVALAHPKDGLTSLGFLDYYNGNQLIKSEQIRKNKYSPQQGLIVQGTHPRPTPPPITNDATPLMTPLHL